MSFAVDSPLDVASMAPHFEQAGCALTSPAPSGEMGDEQ
jgi:hypothetical protein